MAGVAVGDHAGAHQQGGDIGRTDVVADLAGLLRPVEQDVEGPFQLALDGGVDLVFEALLRHIVGQVTFLHGEVDQFGHEREQRRPGSAALPNSLARLTRASSLTITTAWNSACLVGKWR